MEQELLTLPEHTSSSLAFCRIRIVRSLGLCVGFSRSFLVSLSFLTLAMLLSVLLRFTGSDYFIIIVFDQ